MAATLRPYLIPQHQTIDAGGLERADDKEHVDRIAVAGVGVSRQRNVHAGRDIARGVQVLLEPHQPDIGPAEVGLRQSGTRDAGGFEPHLLHQPGGEPVVNPRLDQDLLSLDQLAEQPGLVRHRSLP
jgi:hypothetical protein